MKKLFYGLGAVAAVVTPVVAVVSCGTKHNDAHNLESGVVTEESLINLYKGYGHDLPKEDATAMVQQFGANAKFVVKSNSGEYAEKIEVIIIGGKRLTTAEAEAAALAHINAKHAGETGYTAVTALTGDKAIYYELSAHTGITYTSDELAKATYTITIDKDGVTGIRAIVSDKQTAQFLNGAVLGYRLNAIK